MKKHLLAGLIAAIFASGAQAFDPFTIKDIRVEGIQRTEAGTVFSYLPVKVGDTMTNEKASQVIKSLFATGFFKDVRVEVEGDVLVLALEERPAIYTIEFVAADGNTYTFDTLHFETVPVSLLSADAAAGATPIAFSEPQA